MKAPASPTTDMTAAARKPRILLFSTLYPSVAQPTHGIFVETRLRHLLASGLVEAKVVAPVPWFPFRHPRFGRYARFAQTPRHEAPHGFDVYHPPYLLPPAIGTNIAPYTLAAGALPTIRRLLADGFDFDLIDAHYFYPDGVAAAIIAEKLNKPLVITARGSDLTLLGRYATPRRLILRAADRANACIGVCKDLMAHLVSLGGDDTKTHVIRNGVDLSRFQPLDRTASRQQLSLPTDRLLLLSVGHLIPRKGHDLVIRLLPNRPDAHLVIVGSGPEEQSLRTLVTELDLSDRVHFAGSQPQTALSAYYSAADALILASSHEGWANVLLEAMACGTPVVATAVNGTPEVVTSTTAGRLAEARTPAALNAALDALLADRPQRNAVRAYAEQFSWDETTQAQLELFRRIIQTPATAGKTS